MSEPAHPGVQRIVEAFARAKARGSCALMPFITAGYPDLAVTERLLRELPAAGADLIEVGIPFSDPIADGPVIAESMHRALLAGTTPHAVLDCIARARPTVPVLVMVSVSIVERIGTREFLALCERSGAAGVIIPDAGPEFWPEARAAAGDVSARLGIVELAAPSTPPARLARIVRDSRAFIYLLARAGVTGERADAPDVSARIAEIRALGDARVAVGFGISTAEHVQAVGRSADGAIVGSAIVRRMTSAINEGNDAADAALDLVRSLRRP